MLTVPVTPISWWMRVSVIGFSMKPTPSSLARLRVAFCTLAVTSEMCVCGHSARNCSAAAMPPMPGMLTSSSISTGRDGLDFFQGFFTGRRLNHLPVGMFAEDELMRHQT